MTRERFKISRTGIFFFVLSLALIIPSQCLRLTKGDVEFEEILSDYYIVKINENEEQKVLVRIEDAKEVTVDLHKNCSDLFYGSISNETMIFLDKALDFEKDDCRDTKNVITDTKGATSVTLEIKVNNLDDNAPQFQIGSNCEMKENMFFPMETSPCKIVMTDLDGMMNEAQLTIQNNWTIFDVDFYPDPKVDDKEATVSIYLKDGEQLDYETKFSYVLLLEAKEPVMSGKVQVAIDVVDQPDQPPRFTKMITTEQFEENTDKTFSVSAEDGDVGINSTISYNILQSGCQHFTCEITINEIGEINVKNVDREEVGDKISLMIEAIEKDDNSSTPLSITFFIIDQDDEWPKLSIDKWNVSVEEGFKGTITTFSVADMDLGDYGTFSVEMEKGISSTDYTKAFELIPDSGYQKATFSLKVINASLLDYENEEWKNIDFNIAAIELSDNTHRDSRRVSINLIDINDEPPVFVDPNDSVKIPESIGAGEIIYNATAVDADKGDIVSYEISGNWGQKLKIDNNGIIRTKSENTFDFEQQPEVMITIRASDKDKTHITTKTLTIDVQDVNDEPPVMRVIISNEDKMVKIQENEKGTLVEGVSITVNDPDQDPKLKLEIDWQESYVTKNSKIETFDNDVYQCFTIKTTSKSIQTIEGTIYSSDSCSPDFEKFDAIALYLKATDEKTVIGDNSTKGSVLINIVDVNDNKPYFIDSSLKDLAVSDGTNTAMKIGVISAHDDDISFEPPFFSIRLVENEPDWIDIDKETGQLTVKNGVTIDCDTPKRKDVSVYITVHDGDPNHDNTTKLSIRIDDVNDEYPQIICSDTEKVIYEKSKDNTEVATLSETDNDRDDPNNRVVFKFETNITYEASDRFSISEDGKIIVKLRNGATLDRDLGSGSYILPIVAYDNPKGVLRLEDHFDLKVVLEDLDDHIPIIPDTTSLDCMETLKKDETLGQITAYDPDEDGDNSDVSFTLTEVLPLDNRNKKKLDKEFFEIIKIDAKDATIKILKDMKGYWGKYNLTIRTKDKGNSEDYHDNVITLTVDKFNFKQPVFEFPKSDDDKKITIDKDFVAPRIDITLINGEPLKQLEVNDGQEHKWDVTFDIKDVNGDTSNDMFTIVKSSNCSWKADLRFARSLSDEEMRLEYTISLEAHVKTDMKEGESPVSVETSFIMNFFSFSQQPEFSVNQDTIEIQENSISVKKELPHKASFPNSNMPDLKPYYFIREVSDTFKVDPDDGVISLMKALDYEQNNQYDIKVIAMNKKIPPVDPPSEGTNVLNLRINVIDVNDNVPIFNPKKFTGALLRTYTTDSTILTVNATDADPTLQNLIFSLKNFDCSSTLKAPDPPFKIGVSDGKITNQFSVTSDMSGYCNFLVNVEDEKNDHVEGDEVHDVNTTVQINVISDDELVQFTFMNQDWYVTQELDQVTAMIDEAFKEYNYKSFLADFSYNADWHNTTAHFYFTNSKSEPVPAEEILGNLTDPNKYSALTKALETFDIHLYYFSQKGVTEVVDDYLKIWMIAAICVLGSLLALVTIIFFFRNRALTRRIKNLSTTKFGSQDSGLNRAGVTAPTTNRNAIEGSNPVFNSDNFIKEVDDDRHSVLSGDSDLLGVENNPDFDWIGK